MAKTRQRVLKGEASPVVAPAPAAPVARSERKPRGAVGRKESKPPPLAGQLADSDEESATAAGKAATGKAAGKATGKATNHATGKASGKVVRKVTGELPQPPQQQTAPVVETAPAEPAKSGVAPTVKELARKRPRDTMEDEEPRVHKVVAGEVNGVPRRMPAAGRWWKPQQTMRSSMTVYKANPRTLSTSWERKLADRAERAEVKALEAQVKAKRAEIGLKLKEKRLAKEKRKAENALKSSKVQVITKTDKIKKMNKKQLRSVLKTQVDQDGNVRYVPLYGGAR